MCEFSAEHNEVLSHYVNRVLTAVDRDYIFEVLQDTNRLRGKSQAIFK